MNDSPVCDCRVLLSTCLNSFAFVYGQERSMTTRTNYETTMKTLSILASVMVVVFLAIPNKVNAQETKASINENVIIDRTISRLAKGLNCLEAEYTNGRPTLRGDVNGDGTADVVVLYTVEGCQGGMNWAQGLVVFLRKGRSIQYAAEANVGAKGIRAVDLKSISGGRINLDTMGYRSNDGACCPSRKGKAKYVFSNGKLREVK